MAKIRTEMFRLTVIPGVDVTAAWDEPKNEMPKALVVIAHGAANAYDHPLLLTVSQKLVKELSTACLRFNFPYRESGQNVPDPPERLIAAIRAACDHAVSKHPKLKPFLAGKSLGARVASMMIHSGYAAKGLIFLGYPLHPMGKPDLRKEEHLYSIKIPMLFVQGEKDPYCQSDLLDDLMAKLKNPTLKIIEKAGHSYEPIGSNGKSELNAYVASIVAEWVHSNM